MSESTQYIIEQLNQAGTLPTADLLTYNFVDNGHIDSLAMMRFIIKLESTFNIQFSDDELLSEQFKTIGGLSNLVDAKRSEQ